LSTPDTLIDKTTSTLDSIEHSFTSESDSIRKSYINKKQKLTSLKQRYLLKIDSLKAIRPNTPGNPLDTLDATSGLAGFKNKIDRLKTKQPTATGNPLDTLESTAALSRYTNKVDSVDRQMEDLQRKATTRIDSLKGTVNTQLDKLKLPKEAQGKVAGLTAAMDKVSVPSFDADLGNKFGLPDASGAVPAMPALRGGVPDTNLPNINPDIPGIDVKAPDLKGKLPSTDLNTGKIGDITGQAGDIQKQVKEATGSTDALGNALETKASEQVKGIPDQKLPGIDGMPGGIPKTGDDAKEQMMDMAKKEAVNHFAGKEAVLTSAMEKMSKYKQKYSSVSSLKDIKDAKHHNEMKGKPLRERLVPALTLQFQSWEDLMLDINPSVGYKFTSHFIAGIGWNHRIAFNIPQTQFNEEAKVYGLRTYGEYTFKKGFGFRLDIESMNTPAKQNNLSTDPPPSRDWVWGALIGIKQKYPIYKKLKGNSQLMYNIFDKDHRSPYLDRVNFRIGLEFTLKKKAKTVKNKDAVTEK
jgi:hypothetical protein